MYMKSVVSFCDFQEKVYREPIDGAVFLQELKPGIWSAAMNVGPEYISQHGIKPLTQEKCRMMIESRGGTLSIS
jgi:hypothetical protein